MYELLSGQLPFAGETVSDCIASILKTELPPLGETENAPAELQRIVRRSLAKKLDERYQTARDLLIDIKNLRRDIEMQAAFERSAAPPFQKTKTNTNENEATAIVNQNSVKQEPNTTSHTVSSAEYITSEIKNHKRSLIVSLSVLLLVLSGLGYWFFNNPTTDNKKIESVAVLPFVNASNDPDTEYLSDGISEGLINILSYLRNVKVTARSSSFKFKGKEMDLQEIANALGAQAIITGKIRKIDDQLVINVEMVNANDRTQIWGEQYTRKASNLLQLQSEISKEIAEKLHIHLTGAQEQQLVRRELVNPQAYELVLKGNFYWNKGGTENRKKAVDFYNQAIAVDPNYSLAYSELSLSYIILVNNSILDPKEFTPKAEFAARRAVELEERSAMAHYAMAQVKRSAWEWEAAEREYKRALELNPNLAKAHSGYSFYLSFMGRHEQAIAENKLARDLDPLSITTSGETGSLLYLARQYDQAIEALNKTLELDQNFSSAYVFLGYVYTAKGMYREAISAYQKAIKMSGNTTSRQIFLGAAYAKAGEGEQAKTILKQLKTSKEYVSPAELAILYAALGEHEEAFASLEKAFAAHDLQLQYLGVDPPFDSLRSDPRFQDLLRRVGLPQ